MNLPLHHKTALITGASRGLGKVIAERFWHQGANLCLVARDEQKLMQLAQQLSASQPKQQIKIFPLDLMEPTAVAQFIHQVLPTQKIDILVNNAAIQGPIGPLWENDWSLWQATLQVNLLSPVALCRAVIPAMIKQAGGKIINLSGGGATAPRPSFSAYAVAKAGLVRFSETLAQEVHSLPITVNCIAPGMMQTDMLQEMLAAGEEKIGKKEYIQAVQNLTNTENNVLARAADLCAYLATEQSQGITGKLISAQWDPWENLSDYLTDLQQTDIYTLRRIVPKDRAKTWGNS